MSKGHKKGLSEKPSDIIRREKKQSFLFRELSLLLRGLCLDEPTLISTYLTRVELTPGKGTCNLFFASHNGLEGFKEALEILKLYRPSLRSSLASLLQGRYTPELIFKYDEAVEKTEQMYKLLDDVKDKN
jgi:ribosome-binding factor A